MKRFIFIFSIVLFLYATTIPLAARAQFQCFSTKGGYCVKIPAGDAGKGTLSAGRFLFAANPSAIPGLEFLGNFAVDSNGNIAFGNLLVNIYYFLLSLVGISALIVMVVGGIRYMLAGDKHPTEAKRMMWNAILGLLLALTSYLILYTINPDLVSKLDL